jgi:hypothetical protein
MDGESTRRILGLTLIEESGIVEGWSRNAEKPMRVTWA